MIWENVDHSNLDGLRPALAHELVYRGQRLAHGCLFLRVEELCRQVSVNEKRHPLIATIGNKLATLCLAAAQNQQGPHHGA